MFKRTNVFAKYAVKCSQTDRGNGIIEINLRRELGAIFQLPKVENAPQLKKNEKSDERYPE